VAGLFRKNDQDLELTTRQPDATAVHDRTHLVGFQLERADRVARCPLADELLAGHALAAGVNFATSSWTR
jgi:hypothetical protein